MVACGVDPKNWRLERFMQTDVSNPWGVAFDEYGQTFLSDASGGANWWSLPLSAKIPHGMEVPKLAQFTLTGSAHFGNGVYLFAPLPR